MKKVKLKLREKTAVFVDWANVYEYLIKKRKQVIVVYAKRHIGREIWEIGKGLFKVQVGHLGNLVKKSSPAQRRGRD